MDFSSLFNGGNQGNSGKSNPLADILAEIAQESKAKMESGGGDFPSDMPEELKGLLGMLQAKGAKVQISKVEGLGGLAEALEAMTGGSSKSETVSKFNAKYGSMENYMKVHFPKKVGAAEDVLKNGMVQQLSGTGTKFESTIVQAACLNVAKDLVMSDLAQNPVRALSVGMKAAALGTMLDKELDTDNAEESYAVIMGLLSVVYLKLAEIQAHRDANKL